MIIVFDEFLHVCEKVFSFLENEYRYQKTIRYNDIICYSLLYKSINNAIEISFEPRGSFLYIVMMRLINDDLPKYPIFVNEDAQINTFYLDTVIELYDHEKRDIQKKIHPIMTIDMLENLLLYYAEKLKQLVEPILKGLIDQFDQLEQLIKENNEIAMKD